MGAGGEEAALAGEESVRVGSAQGLLCASPWARYVPYLTDEESEAHRDKVARPPSKRQGQDLN